MSPPPEDTPAKASTDPEFDRKFQGMIQSWADATSAGKTEDATFIALQALAMAGEEAMRNPTPDLLLKEEADNLENSGEWSKAEKVRREILVLEEASGNFGMIAKAHIDLSRLLRMTGRLTEAAESARAAVASARQINMFTMLVMALESEVSVALELGDCAQALASASEAMRIIEPGKVFDHQRARSLTTLARCLLANNDSAGAARELASSWEVFPQERDSGLPGHVLSRALWWEVKSDVAERQENLEEARQAVSRSIEYRRQFETLPARLPLARALEKLASICRKTGDFPASDAAANEAASLRRELRLP